MGVAVVVFVSRGVGKLHCWEVAVRRGQGGYQTLIHSAFGVFYLFRGFCNFGKNIII